MGIAALATKRQKVFSSPFVEGGLSQNIYVPDDQPIAAHYFSLSGTIVVSNLNGGTSTPITNIWPILCNLMGSLTWQGKPGANLGTGRQIAGVPFGAFWFKNYTEESVAPINNGTAMTGNLAVQTYNVNFTIPIVEFDPKWSIEGQEAGIYRGARYNRPYWSIQQGFLAPGTTGNPDQQAYVAITDAPSYTLNLTLTYSVDYVTNVAMTKDDPCLDLAVEYNPILSLGASSSQANQQPLSLSEFQGRIDLINTKLDANGVETGVNNLAILNGGQLDTRFGGTTYDLIDGPSLQAADQSTYLSGGTSWPVGIYTIDQIKRSIGGMKSSKTFIGTSGTPYVDCQAGGIPAGATTQSVRIIHFASNLSTSMKTALSPFGPWGG